MRPSSAHRQKSMTLASLVTDLIPSVNRQRTLQPHQIQFLSRTVKALYSIIKSGTCTTSEPSMGSSVQPDLMPKANGQRALLFHQMQCHQQTAKGLSSATRSSVAREPSKGSSLALNLVPPVNCQRAFQYHWTQYNASEYTCMCRSSILYQHSDGLGFRITFSL